MGMGLLGAIGGAGEGLQKQGSFWADEKKQARIEEMKIAAEGRADTRRKEEEDRADVRLQEKEGRAQKEFDRQQGVLQSNKRSDRRDEAKVDVETARTKKKEGLLGGSEAKPRSPYEAARAYNDYVKTARDAGEEPMDKEAFIASWERRGGPGNATKGEGVPTPEKYEVPKDLAEASVTGKTLAGLKAYLDKGYTVDDARAMWAEKGKPEWVVDRMLEELGVE